MTFPVAARASAAVELRTPRVGDIDGMLALMAPYIESGDLLPRTPMDMLLDLPSFVIAVAGDGAVVGIGALKRYSLHLAEVRSLAVRDDHRSVGLGRAIVERLVAYANELGVREVFALTRRPNFFYRLEFEPARMERFPDKVWGDCARCPRRDACDEVAVHRLLC